MLDFERKRRISKYGTTLKPAYCTIAINLNKRYKKSKGPPRIGILETSATSGA